MRQHISTATLAQISATVGTPTYVYHAPTFVRQFQQLTQAFSGFQHTIFYACKALTNINIIKLLYSAGANIDCSSINEAKLALHAGCHPSRVLYTSNGISFQEITEAVELGVHVNIDSLNNLKKFGEKFGASRPIGIRLRPNIMAGGNLKISTGHDKSKFGIPVTQLPEILAIAHQYQLNITTLHVHTGSEIKDVQVTVKALEILLDLLPQFPDVKHIDLGGGFKVPYSPTDGETNLQELGNALAQTLETYSSKGFPTPKLWFEPGKYMVSEAGYLLTQVAVMKQTDTICFASVNSGLNHLIRPMFYDAYHHISNISNPSGPKKTYTIVGNICETDTFASDRELPEIQEGDLLLFHNAGAYGFEMASNFNSRFKPAEVLVFEDETFAMIRRADVWDDLLRNQIAVL
ncbi:MAG: diaminopimelate decarboxylase [Bacteroidetes bacterium]|nr:MAG: diaminopimelate decarboxylase [Bacteroidota bacterium]